MSAVELNLKKTHILDLKRWLDIPLPPGKMNRNRNEFLKLLQSQAEAIEEQRLDIVRQFAKQEADGKQNLVKPEFDGDNAKQAEEAYQDVMKEPVVIIVDKPISLEVARAVLKSTTLKFGFDEGKRFDEVCEVLGVEFADDEELKPQP